MSETETKEVPEAEIKLLINNLGKQISESHERPHKKCRRINGEVLLGIVNEQKIPGIIYTLQPNRFDPKIQFPESNWQYHSVGILKISPTHYLAFDQTNKQTRESSDFFFSTGSLEEIDNALVSRFGSIWDLNWEGTNPMRSVKGKIDRVEQLLKEGKRFTFGDITPPDTESNIQPTDIAEDSEKELALGLKLLPPSPKIITKKQPFWSSVREKFTFGYA